MKYKYDGDDSVEEDISSAKKNDTDPTVGLFTLFN